MNDDFPPQDAIAVVGLAGRFPGAPDVDAFWRLLAAGEEGIRRFADDELLAAGVPPERLADPAYVKAAGALDGADRFDAELFGVPPREAELLDPQHRLFLETAWLAFADAGHDPGRPPGRVAVFGGAGHSAYLLDHAAAHAGSGFADRYRLALANDKDFLATRVSYKLDLTGPSLTVGTACSTSLVAVCLACQALAVGDCDAALAGGVSIRLPLVAGYTFEEDAILSPDGHCRPYADEARGTVPGSGVGVVLLRRLADALADGDPVRAVVRGWATTNDGGSKAGYTAPRAEGQAAAIAEALALAEVDPAAIGYVEGHGTGTRLGDPIEVAALNRAFGAAGGADSCPLGSVKSNVGHLDSAAGIAGLAKVILALEHERLPATLHAGHPSPRIDWRGGPFHPLAEAADWPRRSGAPRRAGVSSFGIGGTNAHLVVEEAPMREPAAAAETAAELPQLLLVSARDETALERATGELAAHLAARATTPLADVARTLRAGRPVFRHRRALVVPAGAGAAGAAELLEAPPAERSATGEAAGDRRPVAFLFPGQGAQHAGMGSGLYRDEPLFRREIDRCREVLAALGGDDARWRDWAAAVAAPAGVAAAVGVDPDDTAFAQPALFAVEHALARLWMARGVEPDVLAGHSIGELVAATLAGVFTLPDALALLAARGRLMAERSPGAMTAVALPAAEVVALAGEAAVEVAAENGPAATTVGGPVDAIEAFEGRLAEAGVGHRRLPTSHAFHTSAMAAAVEPFRAAVAARPRRAPERPFPSSVTGTWIRPEEATDPGYWARQVRRPVRFAPLLDELLAEPGRVLLEVGPGSALTGLAGRHPVAREMGVLAVASLPHRRRGEAGESGEAEREAFLAAAGRLWAAGVGLGREDDRGAPIEGAGARRARLPAPPLERKRFWLEPATAAAGGAAALEPDAADAAAIVKRPDPADWFSVPVWVRMPAVAPVEVGADGESAAGAGGAGWLVVAAPEARELARALAAELERRGTPAALAGGAELCLDEVGSADGWAGLLAARAAAHASDAGPERIALLAPADPAPALLAAAQALGRESATRPVHLVLVTDGLFPVLGPEADRPERGAAAGLAKVVPLELPRLACRLVDLPPAGEESAASPAAVARLAEELLRPNGPPEVALRGAHRWRRGYQPVRLERPAAPPLRTGGHYVLAGGAGHFGRRLGEHLASAWQARLTVLDLAPPPPAVAPGAPDGSETPGAAETDEEAPPPVDLTDRMAVAEALRRAVGRHGPIDGVVHAAGLPANDYAPVAALAAADLERAAAPKLAAARVLASVVGELAREHRRPPAFCTVTSSLAAVMGGVGLGAFAAADAALDLQVEIWRAEAGGALPWTSVAWEGWEQLFGGGTEAPGLAAQQNALAMTGDEVVDVFERSLAAGGEARLVVATGDLERRLAQVAEQGRPRAREVLGRPAGAPLYRPPEGELEERIAAIWQEVLGVGRAGRDDDFFLLGGDSLAGLQVLSKLRLELAVELPLESFFEARTVARMAEAVAAEHRRGEDEEARMAALLAEIEELSDEELEAALASEAGEEER